MPELKIVHWLFIFLIFMFIGWCQESTIESLYHKKPINRGFLSGPYIPIYGFGGVLILLTCLPFRDNAFYVFCAGLLACTSLEYFTGYLVEKILKKQLWDYSMMKFVYKNRVSLISSLFWGILSLFLVYVLFDTLYSFVVSINVNVVSGIVIVMYTILFIDITVQASRHIRRHDVLDKLNKEQVVALLQEKYERIAPSTKKRHLLIQNIVEHMGLVNMPIEKDEEEE